MAKAKVKENDNRMTLDQMIEKLKQDMKESHHKDWLGWVSKNKFFELKAIPMNFLAIADGLVLDQNKIDHMTKSDLSNAPVIVVHKDGNIIDGNHRYQALKKQGAQTIQIYAGERKL